MRNVTMIVFNILFDIRFIPRFNMASNPIMLFEDYCLIYDPLGKLFISAITEPFIE